MQSIILRPLSDFDKSRLRLVGAGESRFQGWQGCYDIGTPRLVRLRVLGSEESDEEGVGGCRERQLADQLWQSEVADDRHFVRRDL